MLVTWYEEICFLGFCFLMCVCHVESVGYRMSHRVVLLFHHVIRERWVVMNIHRVLVIQPVIIG